MQGANEFGKLFGQGEFRRGRLLIVSGEHARGRYFHIYVVGNDGSKTEVYGILGGHPGWTEYYGWLHKGKWQEDFAIICEQQKLAAEKYKAERLAAQEAEQRVKETQTRNALAAY